MKDRAAKIATYFWESHGNLIDTEWRANLCRAIRLAVKDERERCLLAGQGGEVPNDIGELREQLAQAEHDRDEARRLLAATERALQVMATDYVRLARSYGFAKGKPDERATYWMEVAVLSDFIAYEAIRKAEDSTKLAKEVK